MRLAGLALLLLAAVVPARAGAQSADSASLTLSGFSGSFGTATVAQLDAGVVPASSQLTATITRLSKSAKAQTAHLYIATSSNFLGATTKPSTALQWRTGSNVFAGLSTTNALVGVYSIPTKGGGTVSAAIDLQMLVSWTDPPGSYNGTSVVVTMTVP